MFTESDGRKYSIHEYEAIVKQAMSEDNIDALIEHSNKLKAAGYPEAPSALSLNKKYTCESWLGFLNRNGSEWAKERLTAEYCLIEDYDMVSWTYECFVKGLEDRGEKVPPVLYYQVGYYKYMQVDDDLPYDVMIEKYEGKILAAGQWYKRAVNAGYSLERISDGKWCINYYTRYEQNRKAQKTTSDPGGCYIATAVYGSYDCPQVWTLRRYRDQKLLKHVFGRLFVSVYYAVSPTMVKMFGKTKWFNRFWKGVLDKKVIQLQEAGFEDTPYYDR